MRDRKDNRLCCHDKSGVLSGLARLPSGVCEGTVPQPGVSIIRAAPEGASLHAGGPHRSGDRMVGESGTTIAVALGTDRGR